jgi:hypothetical protein
MSGFLQHTIRTIDESFWFEFNGHVPSVGQIIETDEPAPEKYIVKEVSWVAELLSSGNLLSAVVLVEEYTE